MLLKKNVDIDFENDIKPSKEIRFRIKDGPLLDLLEL